MSEPTELTESMLNKLFLALTHEGFFDQEYDAERAVDERLEGT